MMMSPEWCGTQGGKSIHTIKMMIEDVDLHLEIEKVNRLAIIIIIKNKEITVEVVAEIVIIDLLDIDQEIDQEKEDNLL